MSIFYPSPPAGRTGSQHATDRCVVQLTDKGLAAEISATGAKYYKDDDLN